MLPLQLISGYGFTLDALTRLNPNDSFAGVYYFWWTNLTYLPLFFFLLLFLSCLTVYGLPTSFKALFVSIFIVIYSTELFDYLGLNCQEVVSSYGFYGVNTLLTNTLNRYHPLVFYMSAACLLSIFFYVVLCGPVRSGLFLLKVYTSSVRILWICIIFNLFALWMGSWWALQEGTWGGWWNWDSSEMFGLLVGMTGLLLSHTRSLLTTYIDFTIKLMLLITILLLSYFFIQLNFDLVSHNFGAKFFFFFNNNLFFLEAIILLTLLVCALILLATTITKEAQMWQVRLGHTPYGTPQILRLLFVAVGALWTLWSYRPLLNYFMWNFAEINILNHEVSLQPLNFLAGLAFLTWLQSPLWILTPLVVTLTYGTPNWLWLWSLTLPYKNKFSLLHTTLCLISLCNLSCYDLVLITWISDPLTIYEKTGQALEAPSATGWTPDVLVIESTNLLTSFIGTHTSCWNAYTTGNSPAVNFFSLQFSHNSFQNIYNLGLSYTSPSLFLEIPALTTLNFFFISVLVLVHVLSRNRPTQAIF